MSDHLAIPIKNRAQVLDDYLNFARANMTNYETALDLTRYLMHEKDYVPWTAAVVALDYLDIMLYGYLDYVEWKVCKSGNSLKEVDCGFNNLFMLSCCRII